MNINLQNKVIIVTGAAGGLGAATVAILQTAGAQLALVENRIEKLTEKFTLHDALLIEANLLEEQAVIHMVEQVVAQFGRIDALINIAGGFNMGSKLHETETRTWEFMFNLNATSAYYSCKHVLPTMLQQERGAIVNIGAYGALDNSKQKMTPYVVSKQAVIRLTEALAAEYRRAGITVNCILPGTIDTAANRAAMPNANHDNWVAPAEIGGVIAFLCSDLAREIQGAKIPVIGKS